MNDFSDLEAELKQLRPTAVSQELTARVERALAEVPQGTPAAGVLPKPKLRMAWLTFGLGAAAVASLLLLARINFREPASTPGPRLAAVTPAPAAASSTTSSGFVPEGVTRVVYQTRDEGLVFPERANEPVRRVRSRTRETLKWRDPGTGASLRVSYPAEELQFIPVSGQ
jgi:hypothetical protein